MKKRGFSFVLALLFMFGLGRQPNDQVLIDLRAIRLQLLPKISDLDFLQLDTMDFQKIKTDTKGHDH